jgi:hypothetical protein
LPIGFLLCVGISYHKLLLQFRETNSNKNLNSPRDVLIMNFKTQLYINGEWRDAIRGGKFDTINPATEEVIASVASATAEDIDGM